MAVVRQHRDQLPGGGDRIVYQRGYCCWVLPDTARSVLDSRVNPRHLPVVIQRPTNEDYLLRLAIRRLRNGYTVTTLKKNLYEPT